MQIVRAERCWAVVMEADLDLTHTMGHSLESCALRVDVAGSGGD